MGVDISNGIVLNVKDGISASIPNKLATIQENATGAAEALDQMQKKLNAIGASGVGDVATSMRTAATAVRDLAANTDKFSTAGQKATAVTGSLDSALTKLTATAGSASTKMNQLSQATASYNAGARTVVSAANQAITAEKQLTSARSGGVAATTSATTAVGLLEGRMLSANRGAAQFLVKILGLGPALQAAFVITGALALIEVLVQVVQGIDKVIDAFHAQSEASRNAAIQAVLDDEKIIKSKRDLFTASNLARIANGDTNLGPTTIEVQNAHAAIEEVQNENKISAARRSANEAGKQGLALQQQRVIDLKEEQGEIKKQKDAMDALTDSYKAMLTAQHDVTVVSSSDNGITGGDVTTKKLYNITDEKQIAAINEQMKTSNDESKRLDASFKAMAYTITGAMKKEPIAALKDETKAATKQLKEYEAEFDELKKKTTLLTPQATLAFWQSKDTANNPKTYQQNQLAISGKEGNAQQEIDRQTLAYDALNEKLQDQIKDIGLYSDAMTIKRDVDKDVIALAKQHKIVTAEETESIKNQVTEIVRAIEYNAALKTIYKEFDGPAKQYAATNEAIAKLWGQGAITQQQATDATNKATQAYKDAIDPLNAFNRGLEQQKALSSTRATSSIGISANAQVGALSNNLQNNNGKSKADADALAESRRSEIVAADQAKQAQDAYNKVIETQSGALEKLVVAQNALTEARRAGVITDDAYNGQMVKITNEIIHQHEEMGDATYLDQAKGALANYAQSYTSAASAIGKVYDQTFKTIADGAADSIGRAIVYADNLNDALKNVARQALQQIISGLIKVAIQWAITKFFHQDQAKDTNKSLTEQAVATTAAIAGIAAITAAQMVAIDLLSAPAWDLAEAVSLYSFGANAAGAVAGIAAVTTAGAAAAHLATGGYVQGPGTSTSDSIPAKLSNGEYVWDAKTTQENWGVIAGIHQGMYKGFASGGFVGASVPRSSGNSVGMSVEVHNYAGVHVQTEQMSDNRIRMIVRQEAPAIVDSRAPMSVARDIENPNGHTSKAIYRNVTTDRIR